MTSHLAASRQQMLFPEMPTPAKPLNTSVRQNEMHFLEASDYLNNQYYIYMQYSNNSCAGLGGAQLVKETITLRDDHHMPIFNANSLKDYFNQVVAYTDSHKDVDMSQYEVVLWSEVSCIRDL